MKLNFTENVIFEDISNSPDDSDLGFVIECDLSYLDNTKEKKENFPFCREKKLVLKINLVIL